MHVRFGEEKRIRASYSTPNQRRFRLSRGGDRSLFAPCYRLVDAQPTDNGCRAAGVADGCMAAKAEGKGSGAFGSGIAIHQHGLDSVPEAPQSVHSISRRGNCLDNAVAESFFNLLKRERIRRKVYRSRGEARQDVFDYIEMFYNPKRKHVRNGMLSPVEFEKQQKT